MKIEFPLQKDGYNPFIDYMKGWAILAVVLQHAVMLPGFEFTMMQAVPLFLLIQIFHCYKHGLDNCRAFNFGKTWHRILKPFIITQLIIVFIAMLSSSNSLRVIVKNILLGGGTGPGSYYPWIYIQFAILLPIIGKALRGMSLVVRGGIYLQPR